MNRCTTLNCRAFGLALCAATTAFATDAIRNELHAFAGQELRVRTHERHGGDCQPAELSVEWIKPPSHGRAEARKEPVTAGGNLVGNVSCSGVTLTGLVVYYTPDADFHGSDEFVYDSRGKSGALRYDNIVDVR